MWCMMDGWMDVRHLGGRMVSCAVVLVALVLVCLITRGDCSVLCVLAMISR